jgi:hypothetical protein
MTGIHGVHSKSFNVKERAFLERIAGGIPGERNGRNRPSANAVIA